MPGTTRACGPECDSLLAKKNGPQRHTFAIELAKDGNRKRAYEASGYTARVWRSAAAQLLSNSDVWASYQVHLAAANGSIVDDAEDLRQQLQSASKANVFDLFVSQSPEDRSWKYLRTLILYGVEDRESSPPSPAAIREEYEELIQGARSLLAQADIIGAMSMLDEIVEDIGRPGYRKPSAAEMQKAINKAASFRPRLPEEIPPEIQCVVDEITYDQSRGIWKYKINRAAAQKLLAQVSGWISLTLTVKQAESIVDQEQEAMMGALEAIIEELLPEPTAAAEGFVARIAEKASADDPELWSRLAEEPEGSAAAALQCAIWLLVNREG